MSHFMSEANKGFPYLIHSFGQELTTDLTNSVLSEIAKGLLDELSEAGWSAAGLYIADCITSGDFPGLCNYDPDVLDLSAHDQSVIYQCLGFFAKREDIELGIDKEEVARRKFWQSEQSCRLTNQCLLAWTQGRFQFPPRVEHVLHRAQRKISKLVGPAPSVAEIRVRFGPGATTQTPKQNANPLVKLERLPACSTNLADRLESVIASLPCFTAYSDGDYADFPVHVSRLSFVPKNARTYRAICTEPVLNSMFQLGIGDALARRLKTVGIDLQDQSANQRAALYGSISNASATVDLSSASDTISTGLVKHLFPEDWVDLFASFRTAEMLDQGKYHYLEKISSMGNGFTFPLETIIFWAIAQSCSDISSPNSRVRTLVYGDDIVVDSAAWPLLRDALACLGFTPNAQKTFHCGTFRESCGKDYVLGTDVRPVFVKSKLTGADFFRLHNFFRARCRHDIARKFEMWIHPSVRLRGPSGYGDGHLHSSYWVSRPKCGEKGWGGYTFETFGSKPKELKRKIAQRFLAPSKKRPGRGSTPFVFRERLHPVVRTLAVYTQYLRESSLEVDGQFDRHVYADRRTPDPVHRDDKMFFVTPGVGLVRRMKVYTFEPPFLMN